MTQSEWIDRALELRRLLSTLDGEERVEALQSLPESIRKKALTSPYILGRDKQVEALTSDADTVLCLAGRGWGKNWIGSHWLLDRIEQGHRATGLVGETAADVRDDIVEPAERGSGVVEFAEDRELEPRYKRSESRIEFKGPSGPARAQTYSGDKPKGLRGFSGSVAWIDELAKMRYSRKVWDQINLTLREGSEETGDSQLLVTTTPRPTPLIRSLVEDSDVHVITGDSWENKANLDGRFRRRLEKLEGTRLGRQEVGAEILDDAGDLWEYSDIEQVGAHDLPDFVRIAIGLDPTVSDSTGEDTDTDEAGIVVVGLAASGVAYVLEDLSGDLATDEWAAVACGAYAGRLRHYVDEQLSEPYSDDLEAIASQPYPWRRADVIHAETNQGGDLIRNQLQSFGSNAAVNSTHTTQSKRVRAEPVHHLYQRGLVKHVGQLPTLEDQLTDFIQETENDSPDRADALVYAIHELLLDDISSLDSDHIIGLD